MTEMLTISTAQPEARPSLIKPAVRRAHGKRLRDAHAAWRGHAERADPIGILRAADATRQPDLVPLRYGRMLQSPFTFYPGGREAALDFEVIDRTANAHSILNAGSYRAGAGG